MFQKSKRNWKFIFILPKPLLIDMTLLMYLPIFPWYLKTFQSYLILFKLPNSHLRHFDGPPRPGNGGPKAMTTNRCVPTNRTGCYPLWIRVDDNSRSPCTACWGGRCLKSEVENYKIKGIIETCYRFSNINWCFNCFFHKYFKSINSQISNFKCSYLGDNGMCRKKWSKSKLLSKPYDYMYMYLVELKMSTKPVISHKWIILHQNSFSFSL